MWILLFIVKKHVEVCWEVSYGTTKSSGFVSLEFLETKIGSNTGPIDVHCHDGLNVCAVQHLCKTARVYESTHLHLIWLARSVIPGTCAYCFSKATWRHTSFYCGSMYCCSSLMCILQTEGKAHHQQRLQLLLLWYLLNCGGLEWHLQSLRYTYNQNPPLQPLRKIKVSGGVIWSIRNLQVSILQ